jgi:uncharacterized membrane protein
VGGGSGVARRRAVRFAVGVLAVAAVLTLVAMVWLWPRGDEPDAGGADQAAQGAIQVGGEVREVRQTACPADQPQQPGGQQVCGTVTVRLTDGADRGQTVDTEIPFGPGAPQVGPGDRVTLIYTPDSPPGQQYQIMDHQRGRQLWFLLIAFALAVVAFGRWRGLAALAGLTVTFGVLLLFIVPAILDGRPPLLVAIVGAAAIMLCVLYLTHGFTVPTTVAVLGTLASLGLTGALAAIATSALHLTGVASEEDNFLTISNQQVNMQGLLLAGILIGALGVLDDIAVTQAATVEELTRANPSLSGMRLYRAAERVGRAHIASVINTIILAYAGASLPLLLLIAAGDQPLGEVLSSQLMAQEIARSVVGTLGLIAAVPITTALAAFAARRGPAASLAPRPPAKTEAEGWLDPAPDSSPAFSDER